jgi:ACR3 family arsenite efflux pump ArsB
MTSPQAAAPPSTQKPRTQRRQAGLRQANLAVLILLIVQFALGMGVNLYVTLPAAGHPGHASWFGNGALLALHAALGMLLILGAIFVLVRAIMARNATLIVTSAAGLVAILLAAFFGSGFTDKLTDGYSIGMALAFAAALACYAIGLFAAPTGKAVGDAGVPRL